VSEERPGLEPEKALEPLPVPMPRILEVGLGIWVVALLVTSLMPALHEGPRFWWPWCCVAGLALGLIGYAYVRRGRGNAADAVRREQP
jgi:uncharacterized protein DUF2530